MECFIGPCVLESEGVVDEIASCLKEELGANNNELSLIFKGSFDKANRSSIHSYRGPGLEKGLALLESVKKKYGFPVVTDFHLPSQANEVASVVDFLQVPAFLCRQTDLIEAGASACQKYNRVLKIKKGQFLAPHDCGNIVEKAAGFLPLKQIRLTERGSCFGYNNLVVDMSSFQTMKSLGVAAIYDATHSVQRPGGLGNQTGGKREQIVVLARAAVAAGADGVFLETHPDPDKALSDKATAIELSKVSRIVGDLLKIKKAITE